jgi:hypothetical protein
MHVSEGRTSKRFSPRAKRDARRASIVDASRPQPDQCQTVVGPVGPEIFMPEASLRPLGVSSVGAIKVTRLVDMQRDRHLASGDLRRESAPLGQGSRASQLVDLPRDEMALLIELVVHLGMN